MTEKNKIVILNIVPRGDNYKEKGEILHNNINSKRNLNRSKLHFNNYGNLAFVKNTRNFLNNLI